VPALTGARPPGCPRDDEGDGYTACLTESLFGVITCYSTWAGEQGCSAPWCCSQPHT
jgi:hypothetical protein